MLVVKNASSPTDHVYISGNNAEELIQHLTEFRDILRRFNLESTYLIANPYYHMEQQVNLVFYSSKPSVTVYNRLNDGTISNCVECRHVLS